MADVTLEPLAVPGRRAAGLVTHCVYRIATGKWEAGDRLPSVRAAQLAWGVDRRTVLDAYRQLEELGLVRRVERSGVFVREGSARGRIARHRSELEHLYERFTRAVADETGLSPPGVFRYFAELAQIRSRERPECAFVECTATQAQGHAQEVRDRLGVACLSLTTGELDDRRARVPAGVRTLLVSAFHMGEVKALGAHPDLLVTPVSIALDPKVAGSLPEGARKAFVLEPDADEVHSILEDVEALDLSLELRPHAVSAAEVSELIAAHPEHLALMSPRLWGAASDELRAHPRVRQLAFRVHEGAWPALADAIGLPLGEIG